MPDLIALARQKHLGMDDYWLAVAFARARHTDLADIPVMLKPLDIEAMRLFFEGEATRLMRNLEEQAVGNEQ